MPDAKKAAAQAEAKKPAEPARSEVKAEATPAKESEPPKPDPKAAGEVRAVPITKPSEPPKKADEPKKAEAKKADEPAVKPEPKKAEAKKAEEPKKSVEAKKIDAKKAEEPKKARVDERGGAAKKGDAAKPKPAAAQPAILDDEIDPSSITAEFFRKDQDSVPPVEEHDDDIGAPPQVVLSPTTLARRARLRRVVAGVVAFAGVVSVAVVGKALATGKRQPPMPPPVEARHEVTPAPTERPAAEAPKPAAEPEKVATATPTASASAAASADAPKADDAKKDAKADDAKKDDDKKDAKADDKKDDAKPAASAADGAALKKETLSLLNRGKRKEAIEKAREAIAADGTDAETYLYLGSALQDSGKWKDGIEAYCDCVRNATKGPINECRAMGGHK